MNPLTGYKWNKESKQIYKFVPGNCARIHQCNNRTDQLPNTKDLQTLISERFVLAEVLISEEPDKENLGKL